MLRADHLTRRFGARLALDDVSFDVRAGEVVALLGPNGAGKTTALRLLAGLIAPTAGVVHVNGEAMTPTSADRLRSRIGLLTETPGLWDDLTVRQTLDTYARLYDLDRPAAVVEAAMARFDLTGRANDTTARLSKGLKQRVALARCLLHDPAVVLLDEPTSGLDPESARTVRELILSLRHHGRAVLLCTHNLDEVERVADRVIVLRTRVVAEGTPDELRARLREPSVRITLGQTAEPFASYVRHAGAPHVTAEGSVLTVSLRDGAPAVPSVVRVLVEAGADIESVQRDDVPLEDLYVELLHRDEEHR